MRTWVGTEPGVVLKDEVFKSNDRFSIDPSSLFLFSSSQSSMIPGKIAIRTCRVETHFSEDADVMASRARDKVSNIFMEERVQEAERQREGLSLASLFPKPRPIWLAQPFVGFFGDAFIENTLLGNFLMIYICNFHVLSNLLLIYICKLHWNLNTMFVCQVNYF